MIDAGVAALLVSLRGVMDAASAERWTLVVWPMLWLLPMFAGIAALTWRIAGREAAMLALLLAVFGLPAFQQFRPGRIDHHNVQMALSMLAVAASAWAGRWKPAPWVTGILSAGALAIGFESVPFIAVAGAGLALRYVLDPSASHDLRVYGLTLAISVAGAFLISVGPERWAFSACDALAVNSALALIVAGLATAMTTSVRSVAPAHRACAILVTALLAGGVFVAIEPRCLGGVYALSDSAIGRVWLDHVAEMQSIPALMRRSLATGLAVFAFPMVALVALVMLSRTRWRDLDFGIAASAFLVAFAATIVVSKAFSYAVWFGLPLVAGAVSTMRRLVPRVIAVLVLSPSAVGLFAIEASSMVGSTPIELGSAEREGCTSHEGVAALALLPHGLVLANDLVLGPHILVHTAHSVFAAPYHRLSTAILNAHEVFASPDEEARRLIAQLGIDYIAVCGPAGPLGLPREELEQSLWSHLQTGTPHWLDRLSASGPYRVYRVRKKTFVEPVE